MNYFDDKDTSMKAGWFIHRPIDKLVAGSLFITGAATVAYYLGLGVSKIIEWVIIAI